MVMANRHVFEAKKRQQLELTNEDGTVLETLCDLLASFATLTKYLEGHSYVSISAVQPLIKGIIIAMRNNPTDPPFAVNFKREATTQLETRFAHLSSVQAPITDRPGFVTIAVKATAFDPRFHKLKSLNSGHPKIVRALLEKEILVFGQRHQTNDCNSVEAIDDAGKECLLTAVNYFSCYMLHGQLVICPVVAPSICHYVCNGVTALHVQLCIDN